MRILLVSQMYPGPDDPDLGVFVAQLERALQERGHELERAVLDSRSGGKRRYATLSARALRAARRFRPDVVYAHFLVPAGLIAALAVARAAGRDRARARRAQRGRDPGVGRSHALTVGARGDRDRGLGLPAARARDQGAARRAGRRR